MHTHKVVFASLALCCAVAMAPSYAHEPPISPPPGTRAWVEVEPVGVDLAFTCSPHLSGDITYCSPVPGRYGRYVDTANWRMDHAVSMPGTCSYNRTYGYANNAVWVAGKCVAKFMAPNLRYGDEFNHQRALRSHDQTDNVIRTSVSPCCIPVR